MKRTVTGQVARVMVARDADELRSTAEPQIRVTFEGFEGDRHSGMTMRSGSRASYFPRGTEIRNTRQVSIVSEEDLAATAEKLGIPELHAEWLGANLLVRGIPALSLLPPGTRLIFEGGVSLAVEEENHPCTTAGQSVQDAFPTVPGLTTQFPKAAVHRRGLVAWVERPGTIAEGESVRAEIPEVQPYDPA